MRHRTAAQVLIALCCAARVGAQDTTTSRGDTAKSEPGGMMVGFALGVPGSQDGPIPMLFTAGANFTQVRPNHLGADVSVGTMPYILSFGVVPLGLRVGVALPVSVAPHVLLIPSTGVSLIGAIGPGGGGGLAGANAGASAVFHVQQVGLKTGITWHGFSDMRGTVWLLEFGFVNVPAGVL